MPAERRFGMDHPHYDWSPIVKRGALRWPEQARVALCVVVTLEHTEWSPPADSFRPVLAGGVAPRPFPDYALFSHRDYGHRVGIFRVLDVLEQYGITPTVAMDALTAEHYPYLVRHCLQRGCEIIGHGIGVRVINSTMSEQQEMAYIQQRGDRHTEAHDGHHAPGLAGTGVRRVGSYATVTGASGHPLCVRLGQ